ncbi:class I adenylate-forming enzyme family protein [Actinomadura vinacea]
MTTGSVETLAGTLDRHARERGGHPALTAPDGTRTYGELRDDVARIADRLRRSGLRRGDRIAVLARNGPPYVQLVYAASWAGVVLVCLNWRLEPAEVRAVLDDSDPSLVFAEAEFARLLDAGRPVVWLDRAPDGDPVFASWRAAGDPARPPDADQDEESVALLLYTTGTTGTPKGVQLVERNFRHMAAQATAAWRMHAGMRFLACLPLFHVSGMSSVMCCVSMGGEVVVPAGTSVPDIAEAVQRHGVTHTTFVPTVLAGLVGERAAESHDLSSLEVVIYGSAPAGGSLIGDAMRMLPGTGFSQGYGLTETCAGVAIAPIHRHGDVDPRPGTVGAVVDTCECRIVAPETGRDVAPGEDGEIWLRTPQLTVGYWNRPEQTAAAISPDGWFRTGDIGCLDGAGFLYIRDRLKDMIISGGENIYSIEVENAITSHPAVFEAAVVGVPHPHWGETVKAVVVLRQGETLDAADLEAWLDGRLARYKRPRIIGFAAGLPKTGSGKILKHALRDKEAGRA